MRTPPDLHPDDLAARENLRDMLVEIRRNYGMSQADVAQLLQRGQSAVHALETAVNWQLSTVQRWAYALRLRLYLWPECLPPGDDVYLLRPVDPHAGMAFDRRVWIDALTDARRWVGLTQQRVADRLSIGYTGVAAIEHERDILLVNGQRYCRALNSRLLIEVEDIRP